MFWALSNKTNSFTSCPFLPQAQQRSKRLPLYWPVTAASSKESVYNTSVVWLAAKYITMSKYTTRLSWQSHCNHFSKTGAKVCEMLITSYALAEGCLNFNDKVKAHAIKQLTQHFIKVHHERVYIKIKTFLFWTNSISNLPFDNNNSRLYLILLILFQFWTKL